MESVKEQKSENEIIQELQEILKIETSEEYNERRVEILVFGKGLSDRMKTFDKDFRIDSYKLWHVLIGSTPPERVKKFDTPNHDIEKFIRSLKK